MGKETILSFEYNGVLLKFVIEEDKRIYLLYAGESKVTKPISKNKRNFMSFVEADIAEDPSNAHHGFKSIETSYSLSCRYVTHRVGKNEKGTELIITTRNDFLEIETHFQFYDGISGLSSFNEVRNTTKDKVTLLYVSSFACLGFAEANTKDYELYRATNSWHVEAQWIKDPFLHLGIFNGNGNFTNRRFNISNTGSWSTKDHLPMMVIHNKRKNESTLVQIENNGSWNLEIGDIRNKLYYVASGPEFNDHSWKKSLSANDVFSTAQATVVFGKSFEDVIQKLTLIRRKYRRFSLDNVELPVIFNDYMHALWDTQTTELIKPLVDIASDVNCDIFCVDAGWFAEGCNWWDTIGKWEEYEPNFPNGGFKAICDYIRSKGMKPGLWIEPEAVGINSPILGTLKDGSLFKANGVNCVHQKRYTLNFDDKDVYDYMLRTVSSLVKKYGLAYIKTDYNTDAGVGNEYNSDSLGDGLLKHNRAYVRWLNELMDKYPGLTIENCASGGCRMDNELLKYCQIQSTSDQTDFKKYPYLSVNVLTATTPEQAAVWSYPVNAYIKGYMPTDEEVVMNMCNAMLGRIHLASYINKLPDKQLDLIREGVAYFNSISRFKTRSVPAFPKGIPHFFDKEVVGGLTDGNKMVLGVWNTSNKVRSVTVDLSEYEVKDVKVAYPVEETTDYAFDKETKTLTVDFKTKYGARIFEAVIK